MLRWKAGAVLGDKNGDDAYRFCIYYTVVSWDSNTIDAYVIQDNVDHSQTLVTPNSLAADGETTAQIHLLQGQQEGPFLRAVVPRGFHLIYNDKLEDHHVFQVGFDFTDRMFPGLLHDISWDSLAILKDKSTRPFIAAEMISLVGGRGAGWKWGYATRSSLQRRSRSDCQTADVNSGYHSEWISIPDVTFHHAVPILSMWDTGDICTDHHVQVIGVRIADWSYDPPEGDSTGTLHVQVESAFQDNGGNFSSRGSTANYKVNVLGFNRD